MKFEILNDKLNENIKRYNLPQTIKTLTAHLKEFYPNENSLSLYKNIIFKSNARLSFQKSEIDEVNFYTDIDGKIKVDVTLNFLSIFGSSSPLPTHYSEMVLRSFDMDKVLYDFLNLFNNRLQRFVFPIWQKHRYYIQYKKGLKDSFSKYILSFLGLYTYTQGINTSLNLEKVIPYIGILSMKQKSEGTLKSILRHYLSHDDIEIIQCIKDTYVIPSWQQSSLGDNNMSLGDNFLIGESVVSKNLKFQILLKNVKSTDLIKYSIHGDKMGELKDLISFSLNEPLENEVCLEIKSNEKIKFELNEERYLGINCWIGDSLDDERIIMAQKG